MTLETVTFELTGTRTIPWKAELPHGLTPVEVVFGRDDNEVGEVQVALATASTRPTKAMLDAAVRTRSANTAMPVVVVATHAEGVWFSDGHDGPIGPISSTKARILLQSVLDEPDGIKASNRLLTIRGALANGGAAGFDNHFLFASYYLRTSVPRREDWAEAQERAESLRERRGAHLIQGLGFETEPVGQVAGKALMLRSSSGSRRAVAVLLNESEHFDQASAGFQLSPVAYGLELAGREEVPWLVVLRKSTLRLYPGRDGVGVGQRGQSETYFELDLAFLESDMAGLLPLIFSVQALERGGSADEILDGSSRYAVDLGERLRDRVYVGVVPAISIAIAERLPKLGLAMDAAGLQVAYALTLRILFRLLFQAYGEDSELLPAGRNKSYDGNSLQAFVEREAATDPAEFSTEATSVWRDLRQVWDVIFHGNPRWEVPAYGGSLFDPATEEGRLLQRLELPDSVLGPALQAMLVEVTEDGVRGPVDFRSLQVRDFGTIYEGLLESSLSLAESDLVVNAAGAYVPAKDGDVAEVEAGRPYFHSASGERKATGSYYTPKIVVDHLITRSVEPALEKHLARVRELMDAGEENAASDLFWDFRVADLAMGSAHFLVAAVDKIERGMRDFLTATPLPRVRAELARLAEKAKEALGDDREAAERINEAQLLRRQIARRCVYGLDINPLAVELSRLALWIHTFVPGLPMSSLDHGLVLGNSLTGIGTIDEALEALDPNRKANQLDIFDEVIVEELAKAKNRLADFAAASEADRSEVQAGARLLAQAKAESATTRRVFDAAVVIRIGEVVAPEIYSRSDLDGLLERPEIDDAAGRLLPAHMPYLFPEVFLRDNPGFDVLVGNPPWEKLHVEEHQWWGLRIPKLRSMPQQQRKVALAEFRATRPDLEVEYQSDIGSVAAINKAVASGPFPGIGAAHLDLYQAFAWRFWRLIRSGGRTALVLPRGALSGSALQQWRRSVLADGSFADVCFLANTGGWIFPNVDGRYTVGLTVLERGDEHVVRFCGPFASEAEFTAGMSNVSEISGEEFLSWSSTAAFPLIPDPKSAEIFLQLKKSPRFDVVRPDWEFRPIQGDFNATGDKDKFEFDVDEALGRVPVLAGAAFNLWDPDFGKPYAYGQPDVLRGALHTKLERAVGTKRSVYFQMLFEEGELPMDRPRIVFRDVARATDSRTMVACLLPPGHVFTHKAPVIVRRAGGTDAEVFLIGALSSIPFDWHMRRWVEMTMSFEILGASPVPRYEPGTPTSNRIVEIAGRLAAVDDRYAEWAAEVGVEVGTANSEPVKSDLIAELDALVSLLYGLTEDQVEHVFATFHRGWDYRPRLDAVLAHYANWKDR